MSIEFPLGADSAPADPLCQLPQDPSTRASYSNNPGFTAGADEAHPITSMEKSLLAQPKVAEALEVVYLSDTGEAQNDADQRIDRELALQGLNWLRKNISDESATQLKKSVIRVKAELIDEDRLEQLQIDRQNALRQQTKQRELERQKTAKAEEAKQAKINEEAARQANYRAELIEQVEVVKKDNPQLEFDNLLDISQELEIVKGAEVEAREKIGFQPKILRRVAGYLRDPQLLVNDIDVVKVMRDRVDGEEKESVVYTYTQTVSAALGRSIAKSYFGLKSLSHEIIGKWLKIDGIDQPKSEGSSVSILEIPEAQPATSVDNKFMPSVAARFRDRLFANTLKEIARQQPDKLIDVMYMIAEEGLVSDSLRDVKRHAAVSILTQCFEDEPLAGQILYLSTVSYNDKIQQKALDLRQTLLLVDPERAQQRLDDMSINAAAEELTDQELAPLYKLFKKELTISKGTDSIDHSVRLSKRQRECIEQFLLWVANTPEGASSTMLGRVMAEEQFRP